MELSKVQDSMMNYFVNNRIFGLLLPFSSVFVILYGAYSVVSPIGSISFISKISAIFYVLYILGCILTFAKNDMKVLIIGFGLKAAGEFISLITYEYRYNLLNCIIYIVFHLYLAYCCMVWFNKTGGENTK